LKVILWSLSIYVDDHRSGKFVVELNGRLNKCGVISPRFDVGVKEIEGWTARLLPSRQVSLRNFLSVVLLYNLVLTKRIIIDVIVCIYG
jgi:ribosomal protein S8